MLEIFYFLYSLLFKVVGNLQEKFISCNFNLTKSKCRSAVARRCSVEKLFSKFTVRNSCQSFFFDKVADLQAEILLKGRFQHKCFFVNFAKFFRTDLSRYSYWKKHTLATHFSSIFIIHYEQVSVCWQGLFQKIRACVRFNQRRATKSSKRTQLCTFTPHFSKFRAFRMLHPLNSMSF